MNNTKTALQRSSFLIIVLGSVLLYSVISHYANFSERRWYRDFTMSTPFHSVLLHSVEVDDAGVLIAGEMVKRRCRFEGLRGYITFADGTNLPVDVDTKIEQERWRGGNRPPTPQVQLWGKWRLAWDHTPLPVAFEVWAVHKCPGENLLQSNLFLRGPWIDYTLEATE